MSDATARTATPEICAELARLQKEARTAKRRIQRPLKNDTRTTAERRQAWHDAEQRGIAHINGCPKHSFTCIKITTRPWVTSWRTQVAGA